MLGWFKRRSLIVAISILLSILFIIIVLVLSTVMYQASVDEVYRKFTNVGDKLTDMTQTDLSLIEKTAPMIGAGENPPKEEMEKMQDILTGTTDDYLVANAYYFLPTVREDGEDRYFRYLQVNASLEEFDLYAGDEYEDHGSFSKIFTQTLGGKSSLTDVFDDEYGSWLTYLSPLINEQGEVVAVYGIDYDFTVVKQRLNALIWKTVVISVVAISIIILAIWLVLRIALRPLQIMTVQARKAADGDFTVSVPITSSNEIGQTGTAFNDMVANLRVLAVRINQTSNEVAGSSSHLEETANETKVATNEITQSITQVAINTETQLFSSGESQRAMVEFTTGIQRIVESTASVSDFAVEATNLSNEGTVAVQQTMSQMETIEEQVNIVTGEMGELNTSNSQISNILAHIADIANQTNLLSLNASIEAARAGEHGKGFAVVAQEISKLAERSKVSSEEVNVILSEIATRSEIVTTSLNTSVEEARIGTQLAGRSRESFQTISDSMQKVSTQMQDISATTEQISAGSEEIAAALVELESTAQTTSDNSQQVAAASEEQLASMEEVVNASHRLSALGTELGATVAKFKV